MKEKLIINDPFSYSARWDSVGLDCSYCIHQANADHWPNKKRDYKCGLHNVPLRVELMKSGYKEGEWFCKEYENNGKANPKAIKEFETIKQLLKHDMLYGCYGENGQLKEVSFQELEKYK